MEKTEKEILLELKREAKECAVCHQVRKRTLMCKLSRPLQSKVEQALDEFKQLVPAWLTPLEKISLLYQCIAAEAVYDSTQKKSLSYNFVGALRDREAVCMGFADFFTVLVGHVVGCEICTITGYTTLPLEQCKRDDGHAWNLVTLPDGGGTFHLDITWDLWKGVEDKKPKWFMKADHEMRRFWLREKYPAAPHCFRGKMYKDPAVLSQLRAHYRGLQKRFQEGTFYLH